VQLRKGLIVCGFDAQAPALDPDVLAQFARATGYPVWLDVSHPLRWEHPQTLSDCVLRCAELLLGCEQFIAQLGPQMVVQVGPPLTSSLWENWIEQAGARKHIVVAREGWPDPSGQSDTVVAGDPSQTLRALTQAIEVARGRGLGEKPWFLDWRPGDTRAARVLREWMSSGDSSLGELHVVRAAIESCPRGARVVLGNSLPLREAELVVPAEDRGLSAFAIRGANGIDGLLSTAVGAALSGSRPTLILLGDISFLHDIGALWTARAVRNPLAIVILNNHGGRIFEQLPVFDCMNQEMLNFWTTPHELELKAAGQLYGIATHLPATLAALQSSVSQALTRPGPTLIPVSIDPSSPRLDVKILRRTIDASVLE
jgi:2-succinyl-5-enolpyruvyl-6-hydroxy-3-cyclohexene-1-carboxylate synthase